VISGACAGDLSVARRWAITKIDRA